MSKSKVFAQMSKNLTKQFSCNIIKVVMKMKTIYRKEYMEKLENLKDKKIIKVLTGIRRCGKSTILNEFRKKLIAEGVSEKNIISINFDDNSYNNLLDSNTLHEYIIKRLILKK